MISPTSSASSRRWRISSLRRPSARSQLRQMKPSRSHGRFLKRRTKLVCSATICPRHTAAAVWRARYRARSSTRSSIGDAPGWAPSWAGLDCAPPRSCWPGAKNRRRSISLASAIPAGSRWALLRSPSPQPGRMQPGSSPRRGGRVIATSSADTRPSSPTRGSPISTWSSPQSTSRWACEASPPLL